MSGTITVQNIQGPTTGSNANQVLVPSGHTLHSPGHVIQVVTRECTASDQINFTASSYADSVSINFTPKFSNSIIKHTFWGLSALNNVSYTKGQDCRWLRDSTVLSDQNWTNYFNRNTNPIADYYPNINWHYVDSTHNTTSQITYKFQGRSYGGGGSNHAWTCFDSNGGDGHRGQWTIEEIAQ